MTHTVAPTSPSAHFTGTVKPTSSKKPAENKDDKDRKVVLGVVLSIVSAIIVGCIVGVVVYLVWKKRKGVNYKLIPSM